MESFRLANEGTWLFRALVEVPYREDKKQWKSMCDRQLVLVCGILSTKSNH